ncbi:hypothetical protein [Croceicoccus bisphenolivorans]|uniref:hypothetical protein n=1 Tax=Croceicoccus bisphenolivorans TaxID=1783232 RepID=UPI00083514EE|nr:hypothetical protein [Croceicoccus bisphenolivorans]
MMELFDSNAAFWAALAGTALAIAAIALLGDFRRARRAQADAVGCMPWTPIFLTALFAAGIAGFFALMAWLSPV